MRKLLLPTVILALTSSLAQADNQRPSVVKNVSADALTSDSIRLSWNAPWDDFGVQGYNIYRNGRYYSTIFNTTNFLDKGLSAGTQYLYSIVAFDKAKNYSALSTTVNARTQGGGGSSTTPASTPSSGSGGSDVPSGLRVTIDNSSTAVIQWNKPSGDVSGYNVYRDGNYYATVKGSTRYRATSLDSNREYRFSVVAFKGNTFSRHSSDIRVKTSGSSSAVSAPPPSPPPPPAASNNSTSNSTSSGAVPSGYQLVFNDDFRTRSLDASKWNSRYRWGARWTINNEQQYYVDRLSNPNFGHSPFEFDGEHMTIVASRTPDHLRSKANNKSYLSGTLTTYNKFKMKYGYVEMRAKLPKGQGLWPAFWLLHNQENGRRPEIDVVELLGKQSNLAYQTYHYYDNWTLRSSPSYKAWGPDYSNDFHTYGMKWEPGRITWYIDGKATNSHSSSNVADEDMYLLVNLALGGSWGGNVDGSTPFPARFTIDYIRAYRRP